MAYNQSDEEEDNIYLGTPFAPLEDDQIVNRKPDLDLTVRDSKGRRRFHGAFTGGFSAGHYMTVGSEEGFTPQQFVSNRQQRWDQSLIQRKPENFMDSEDLDVFGIAPKKITAKEKFVESEFAGFRKTDSLIDVLKTVIKPTNESIGRQLYKRMKINAKKDDYFQSKVYGCDLSSNKSADNNLLAFYEPKSNVHGIGYKSIAEENESIQSKSSDAVSATFKSGRKIQISGEAFGYGVLDEDIEEDAVVYHKDDMSQYDFAIGSLRSQSKTKNKNKSIDVLKSDVIEGFAKCFNKINLIENIRHKYPIPVLPKDWRKSSVQNKPKKSRWDQTSDAQNVKDINKTTDPNVSSKAPVLNANIRAILLGEEVIHRQGVKKPVPEAKSSELNVVINENKSVVEKPNQQITPKPLFGFWANKFTRSSNAFEESLSGGLTEFKSNPKDASVENENKLNNEENNVIKRTTYEWHPHSLLCKRFNIPNPFPHNTDFVGVVAVGRSDVRNRTSQISAKKDKPNIFECLFNEQVLSDSSKSLSNQTNSVENNVKNTENNTEVKNINENSDEENEDPIRPPMDLFKAIFASDEESEDEDIDEHKMSSYPTVNNESNLVYNQSNDFKTPESNPNKNRGIFANIDFDELNRDFTPFLETIETQNSIKSDSQNREIIEDIQNVPKISESIDDYYGPALPPDPNLLTSNVCQNIVFNETNSKSSKRKKKDKKQKKHKKHKTNHKKHKRHKKSSDSDSSSDEDIEHKILQHLKSARK